jgi:hypothetical protein
VVLFRFKYIVAPEDKYARTNKNEQPRSKGGISYRRNKGEMRQYRSR